MPIAMWITTDYPRFSSSKFKCPSFAGKMSRSDLVIWTLLLFLADIVSMQESPAAVAMIYPPRAREKHPKIYFDPGENVLFNWTSTFPWISLELYQGPRPDGHWVMVPLLSMLIPTSSLHCLRLHANHSLLAKLTSPTLHTIAGIGTPAPSQE